MSEFSGISPASELATTRALKRVIGESGQDQARFSRFVSQVARRQPVLLHGVRSEALFMQSIANITEPGLKLNQYAYLGGAMIYLASAQEQAILDNRQLPDVTKDAASNSFQAMLMISPDAPDQINDMLVAYSREMPDRVLEFLKDGPVDGKMEGIHQIVEAYGGNWRSSPFAEEFNASITKVSMLAMAGSAQRVNEFCRREANFTTTMQQQVWASAVPFQAIGEVYGAASMESILQTASSAH